MPNQGFTEVGATYGTERDIRSPEDWRVFKELGLEVTARPLTIIKHLKNCGNLFSKTNVTTFGKVAEDHGAH